MERPIDTTKGVMGIDLDNTIISYDSLLHSLAHDQGLINGNVEVVKKDVRDAVRNLPNGEIEWQKLQGLVYGPGIRDAKLMDGVMDFFQLCLRLEVPVHIISHKTVFAPYDSTNTNLRTAALKWMYSQGLFEEKKTGLTENSVSFEATRTGKLRRVVEFKCTHFIDDLEETFLESCFPAGVEKILYTPSMHVSSKCGASLKHSWEDIGVHIFGPND